MSQYIYRKTYHYKFKSSPLFSKTPPLRSVSIVCSYISRLNIHILISDPIENMIMFMPFLTIQYNLKKPRIVKEHCEDFIVYFGHIS